VEQKPNLLQKNLVRFATGFFCLFLVAAVSSFNVFGAPKAVQRPPCVQTPPLILGETENCVEYATTIHCGSFFRQEVYFCYGTVCVYDNGYSQTFNCF
jgi:hypothetical protein